MSSVQVESLTLKALLQEAKRRDIVFLTQGGETRFALMPVDEGDQEVTALRSNSEFMACLADCKQRALTGTSTPLAEVRKEFAGKLVRRSPRRRTATRRASRDE